MLISLQNPFFWTWKQLFAIHFLLATSNVCPLAIPEFFVHNMGIRLLANHSFNLYWILSKHHAPLFDSKRSWDTVLSQNLHLCTIQSWTLNFEALAIRASNPQNVLNRISFHLPKSLPRPNHSLNYRDHAVAMAGQLAISPKTFLSCSSRTPLNHGQLWLFFSCLSV